MVMGIADGEDYQLVGEPSPLVQGGVDPTTSRP